MRELVAVASVKERMFAAASVLGALATLGILYVFTPGTSALYPTCPFLAVTGCYCPGCGSLRALHQITRGYVATAFGLNPLLVLSLPFASQISPAFRGLPLRTFFVRPLLIWSLLGVIILYWIIRNVPV